MRVVVVGSGIVGASTAFHLADRDAEVVVIDASRPGAATLAGAGIICPWPTAHADGDYVDLYVAGAHGIGPIVERLGELGETATSFRRVGAVASRATIAVATCGLTCWRNAVRANSRRARRRPTIRRARRT